MEDRENLTWSDFGDASRELAAQVWNSGYRPDMIACVARGGLIPAGAVSYALDMKELLVLNVEYYTGIGTTLRDPRLVDPVPINDAMTDKKVLVIDDVADSGRTLEFVKGICLKYTSDVRVAVLYKKERSVIDPEYVWKHVDGWINFPWSSLPPVNSANGEERP